MDLVIFVVDDDEAIRSSLTFFLRTEGFRARAFASGEELLEQLQPDHHGCVITDVHMPGIDGMALVERLRAMGCEMPVIVITGHADVPLAIRAMKAGVYEFVEKPFEPKALLAGVQRALTDAAEKATRESRRRALDQKLASLTEREREVFDKIAGGQSNKEAALSLGISPRTIEIHRASLMTKLRAENLSELVRMHIAIEGPLR